MTSNLKHQVQTLSAITKAIDKHTESLRSAKKSQNRLFNSGLNCNVTNHEVKKYKRAIRLLEIRFDRLLLVITLHRLDTLTDLASLDQ